MVSVLLVASNTAALRPRHKCLAFLGLLCALCLASACNGQRTRPPTEVAKAGVEGSECQKDNQCKSPLRCIDEQCHVPPAMTGTMPEPCPTVTLASSKHGSVTVNVELATEPDEMARGLMDRDHLAPGWGMLFVYPDEGIHTFWMKNTLIPLDMIFISSDFKIVGIVERAEPLTTKRRSVGAPSQFVLEVKGGFGQEVGIVVGGTVRFENVPVP